VFAERFGEDSAVAKAVEFLVDAFREIQQFIDTYVVPAIEKLVELWEDNRWFRIGVIAGLLVLAAFALGGIATAAAGAVGTAAVLLAIAAGVGALAAGIAWLEEEWAGFDIVMEGLGVVFGPLADGFTTFVEGFLQQGGGLLQFLGGVFTGDFEGAFNGLKNFLIGTGKILFAPIEIAMGWLKNLWNWEFLQDVLGAAWSAVWDFLRGVPGRAAGAMLDIIIGFAGWGLRIGKALVEAIVEGMAGLGQAVVQTAIDEVPVLSGAIDAIGGVVSGGNIALPPDYGSSGGGSGGRADNILSRHTGGTAFRDDFYYLRKGEVVSTPNQAGGNRPVHINLNVDGQSFGHVVLDSLDRLVKTNGSIPLHIRQL
jgi:hypothetical protein